MNKAIILPEGTHIQATPGKYRIVPPPDLNEVVDKRFLLEYDFPFLIVREMATRGGSVAEQLEALTQAGIWSHQHPRHGGNVGNSQAGYQFYQPPSSRSCRNLRRLIPDISYVDADTWRRLTPPERNMAYKPCVPVVVIEIMSETDNIDDLQAKVTRFINAGAREGIIVDTRRDRAWIYNRGWRPYVDPLGSIEFDWWPDFTLDCIAIRDARTRAGLN
jgi:Uma2 family endonuclease